MIHPHTRNIVSVCNKFTLSGSNDGCVGTINTHTAKIVHQVFSHSIRVHNQQGQTILPQITPSSSTTSIVMMGQERPAVNPTKHRLYVNPVHEIIKPLICGMIAYIALFFPCSHCRIKDSIQLFFCVVLFQY